MPEDTIAKQIAREVVAELLKNNPQILQPHTWPEILSKQQAAAYSGRSLSGIEAWMRKGLLPVVKIDGRTQIRKADIDALIQSKVTYLAS